MSGAEKEKVKTLFEICVTNLWKTEKRKTKTCMYCYKALCHIVLENIAMNKVAKNLYKKKNSEVNIRMHETTYELKRPIKYIYFNTVSPILMKKFVFLHVAYQYGLRSKIKTWSNKYSYDIVYRMNRLQRIHCCLTGKEWLREIDKEHPYLKISARRQKKKMLESECSSISVCGYCTGFIICVCFIFFCTYYGPTITMCGMVILAIIFLFYCFSLYML